MWLPFQKNMIFRIFLRQGKREHEALTPDLESLDQKGHKSFSGTSLSCDPIKLQEACKCSPRCLGRSRAPQMGKQYTLNRNSLELSD